MDAGDVGLRANAILSAAGAKWAEDVALLAYRARKEEKHSQQLLNEILQAMEARTNEQMMRVLSELGAAVHTRGRKWNACIAAVDAAFDQQMGLIKDWPANDAYAPTPELKRFAEQYVRAIIARRKGDLSAFGAGWCTPEGKSFAQRHPITWGLLIALGGWSLGIMSEPAKELVQARLLPASHGAIECGTNKK